MIATSLPSARGDVGGGGVGGHRDRVTGVQAVVVAIPADRFAQQVAATAPQRQRGIAFLAVAHPGRGCLLQPVMLRHLLRHSRRNFKNAPTDSPAVSLRLVPIRSCSLPAGLFSGLDGVKSSRGTRSDNPKRASAIDPFVTGADQCVAGAQETGRLELSDCPQRP
jgi:hypothetical protein